MTASSNQQLFQARLKVCRRSRGQLDGLFPLCREVYVDTHWALPGVQFQQLRDQGAKIVNQALNCC
jgi:hypothetical protein